MRKHDTRDERHRKPQEISTRATMTEETTRQATTSDARRGGKQDTRGQAGHGCTHRQACTRHVVSCAIMPVGGERHEERIVLRAGVLLCFRILVGSFVRLFCSHQRSFALISALLLCIRRGNRARLRAAGHLAGPFGGTCACSSAAAREPPSAASGTIHDSCTMLKISSACAFVVSRTMHRAHRALLLSAGLVIRTRLLLRLLRLLVAACFREP